MENKMQWQPIQQAPFGKQILVYAQNAHPDPHDAPHNWDYFAVTRYVEDGFEAFFMSDPHDKEGGGMDLYGWDPVYWTTLPEPPNVE